MISIDGVDTKLSVNKMVEKEIVEEVLDDLNKWSKKINHLMLQSTEGDASQILKVVMAKKMFEHAEEKWKEVNGEEYLEKARDFIEELIDEVGFTDYDSVEKAKKRLLFKDAD